ncbi:hypothetical protein C8Q77DRAFT_1051572 [Trametes polyzona]|nr:hypothetical protein C8Q77DRAFT_1051572 [Trametes polyzona]
MLVKYVLGFLQRRTSYPHLRSTPSEPRTSPESADVHAYPPGAAPPTIQVHKAPVYDLPSSIPQLPYNVNAADDSVLSVYEADKSDASSVDVRGTLRTPSPTPSEARVLAQKTKVFGDWRRWADPRRYANPRGIWTVGAVLAGLIFIIAFLVLHKKIVHKLQPFAHWMHDAPGGWLIPIGIMFIISFPPLFGHEIIAVLCGDVWGVWIGFGIVAAGTLLGELGNYFAFKWCCSARGKRIEEKRLKWALYAEVVREGGIVIPTIMRLTFIPGHLLTAIFSTCGMSVWTFFVAATLSLPKQLAVVYLGVQQESGENQAQTGGIKAVVILATLAMTFLGMMYINRKIDLVKERVVYRRRKARCAPPM